MFSVLWNVWVIQHVNILKCFIEWFPTCQAFWRLCRDEEVEQPWGRWTGSRCRRHRGRRRWRHRRGGRRAGRSGTRTLISIIKQQTRLKLYAETSSHLEIVDADDFRVADHLAARTHVGSVKVQDDVDEKYYWKYIWWKILLKIYSMQNTTHSVSDEKYNWNSLYVRNNCASTKYLWSDTNKKMVLQNDNKLCNVRQRL